jgi:hypothetical protein
MIIVEGEVGSGYVLGDGSATFRGTASVDMADGTMAWVEVPFWVTASPRGLKLTLYATELPTATVSAGSITTE